MPNTVNIPWSAPSIAKGLMGMVALLAPGGMAPPVSAGEPPTVVVLVSQDAEPYQQAVAGLQQFLKQQRPPVTVIVHSLAGDAAKAAGALQEARRVRARALVTLGGLATQAATQAESHIPIVAGMITSAAELGRAPNATAVVLEFPIETQLQWLHRLLPAARTIGVLYNPAENQQRVAAATQVAARLGLSLEGQEARTPRDLPVALESLGRHVDVLWGMADALVLNPETARHILLVSFRSRIPLVGPSVSWVKAGALYALHWDYRDLGTQCGELVAKVLGDVPARSIPVASPRKVLYSVNQRTALHMKIEIPEPVLRGAVDVF